MANMVYERVAIDVSTGEIACGSLENIEKVILVWRETGSSDDVIHCYANYTIEEAKDKAHKLIEIYKKSIN
jgi:hypothetical protein